MAPIYHSEGKEQNSVHYSVHLSDTKTLYVAARTEPGPRHANEDSYLLRGPVLGVFDGLGGGRDGEVASYISASCLGIYSVRQEQAEVRRQQEVLMEYLRGKYKAVIRGGHIDSKRRKIEEDIAALAERVRKDYEIPDVLISPEGSAHSIIKKLSSDMGTTVVAVEFDSDHVNLYHQGDSGITLITPDDWSHLMEPDGYVINTTNRQGEVTGTVDIVTHCIGGRPQRERKMIRRPLTAGDSYLLYSDGLDGLGMSKAVVIARDIYSQESVPERRAISAVEEMVRQGVQNTDDNVTVVLAFVEEFQK